MKFCTVVLHAHRVKKTFDSMESDSDSDVDGRQDFSAKLDFNKIQRNLISSGFREGAAAAREASFQTGFDKGYAEGFQAALALGKFNGVLETVRKNAHLHSINTQELDGVTIPDSRLGLCQLCKGDATQNKSSISDVNSVEEISRKQREVIKAALHEQKSRCAHNLEKAGVLSLLLDDLQ